jgi:hypothetical protein
MRELFQNVPKIQENAALLMLRVNMSIKSKYVTLTYFCFYHQLDAHLLYSVIYVLH